jgi:hypothetical protein
MVAGLMFIAGLFFHRKKKLPRLVPILWFGAAAGVTGWILDVFHTGVGWVGSVTGAFIGVGVLLFCAILWLVLTLGHDFHPKHKGAAGRSTAFAALFLPLLATSVDGNLPKLILGLGHAINQGGSALAGLVF